jgi:ADP-heptose:LPS heptosyltransferase
LCGGIEVERLSPDPRSLTPFIKKWRRRFDFLYLGPHPTWKTSILGRLLAPRVLWRQRHPEANPFLVEQIRADISELGLAKPDYYKMFAEVFPWGVRQNCNPFGSEVPFLVLHPGAKQRWQTTRWPVQNWQALIIRILQNSGYSLCLVGIESESEMLASFLELLPRHSRSRIKLSVSLPMKEIASLIASSSGVVCHNSGILHMATFLKKKTIAVTGSSARYWRPPYPWVLNVTSGQCELACNCYSCLVPFYHARCIQHLSVDRVWDALVDHLMPFGNPLKGCIDFCGS